MRLKINQRPELFHLADVQALSVVTFDCVIEADRQ